MKNVSMVKAAEQLRYLILAAERQGGRMFQESLKAAEITGPQAEVIRVLEEHEPLSLKELGALLICENGSPSRLVDRLVQQGLIQRETDPKDSRYVLLRLTAIGREKAREVTVIENKLYAMISQKVPVEKIVAMNSLLSKLLSGEQISTALQTRDYLQE